MTIKKMGQFFSYIGIGMIMYFLMRVVGPAPDRLIKWVSVLLTCLPLYLHEFLDYTE